MKTAIQNGKIIMNTDTISVLENHSIVIENDIYLGMIHMHQILSQGIR